jgi:hypothetical protein
MESRKTPLPEQRNYEYAHTLAYRIACEELVRITNLEEQCRNSGARYRKADARQIITLDFLSQTHEVSLPEVSITQVGTQEPVPLKAKVLILHYLIRAKGTPPTDRMITFKELPEGLVYFPTFAKRTIQLLANFFGKEPQKLIEIAQILGGQKADYGDASVTINALPRIPITLTIWRGDDEFSPTASVMFDANVLDYLPTEDIIILCETIIWKLVRALK